ncbi:hypothetical protein [Burkholderia gladioli]|uniref:hypothetical protein n=1 Tax=Burkholderia gladioli TaxID=28095 RepID=UPI00164058B5|nr:hypothetical protein [Burkholderia gladioli]
MNEQLALVVRMLVPAMFSQTLTATAVPVKAYAKAKKYKAHAGKPFMLDISKLSCAAAFSPLVKA